MVRYILPTVRSVVTKELVNRYGLPEAVVAKRLGITQPAVSQYLHSKRGKKQLLPLSSSRKIETAAKKMAAKISKGNISSTYLAKMTCELCLQMGDQLNRAGLMKTRSIPSWVPQTIFVGEFAGQESGIAVCLNRMYVQRRSNLRAEFS